MPFTLSHPIAVLIFPRNRYFHFPALVLGAMSPDFLYFFCGRPVPFGHTFFASELINLPLCLLFYGVYHFLLERMIREHLPHFWASDVPKHPYPSKWRWLLVFSYSAWLGMATHIILDDFTHQTGYFVQRFAWLEAVYLLPIYKWLQYLGGVFGLLGLMIYQWRMARRFPYFSARTPKQKIRFWVGNFVLCLIGFSLWYGLAPLPLSAVAIHIIRLVDCFVISLILHGLIQQYH